MKSDLLEPTIGISSNIIKSEQKIKNIVSDESIDKVHNMSKTELIQLNENKLKPKVILNNIARRGGIIKQSVEKTLNPLNHKISHGK